MRTITVTLSDNQWQALVGAVATEEQRIRLQVPYDRARQYDLADAYNIIRQAWEDA